MGVKHNGVDLIVGACDGKDGSDCIIRGVSFDCGGVSGIQRASTGAEVNTSLRRRKDFQQLLEKLQGTPLWMRCYEGNHYIQVALNEPVIEVGEAKEGLNILNFPQLRPVENCLDLVLGHGEPGWGEDISKVFVGF